MSAAYRPLMPRSDSIRTAADRVVVPMSTNCM